MALLCRLWFGFHQLYVVKVYSKTTRKVGCHRCGRCWGMHDGVRAFVPWDGELEQFHEGR